jgi:hypothetical protein
MINPKKQNNGKEAEDVVRKGKDAYWRQLEIRK